MKLWRETLSNGNMPDAKLQIGKSIKLLSTGNHKLVAKALYFQ
jgi:hypothetical protein